MSPWILLTDVNAACLAVGITHRKDPRPCYLLAARVAQGVQEDTT